VSAATFTDQNHFLENRCVVEVGSNPETRGLFTRIFVFILSHVPCPFFSLYKDAYSAAWVIIFELWVRKADELETMYEKRQFVKYM
jgi:hypothetical protein